MSDEEFTTSIRKFLKHLGVTGHQLIEDELRKKNIYFEGVSINSKSLLSKKVLNLSLQVSL